MDVIIMNVQGYWDGYDKFVCKELAAASLDGTFVCHYMFENPYPSPYPGKIKLDHELQLINGDVPYNKLLELMTRIVGRARSIMVHERRMIAQLRDITEINVPIEVLCWIGLFGCELCDRTARCVYDHSNCALENVIMLRDILTRAPTPPLPSSLT